MSSWGCGGRTCVIAIGSTPWLDPRPRRFGSLEAIPALISSPLSHALFFIIFFTLLIPILPVPDSGCLPISP